ncbi:flagellar hook-basal body complex protein FliE [Bacterioplanes sanyensis]|uniref:Flagellar hook-basal body complex protein FliE n=1 Tax=Bacterioplanes sanyensis TaxID=1249553 RepID=A0A222FP84_9GAMM|nr:flagellar hook-basal body complex protein FliE [Bacterioplanes sanyensis]ASP40600.1 flagellar hook-basal body complex protein FliE [Bacterioplanes sanyensis]
MVDRVDVNSVLMQMRQVKQQLRAQQDVQPAVGNAEMSGPRISGDNLARQVERLQQQQQQVNPSAATANVQGDPSIPDFQTMFSNAVNNVAVNQKTSSDLQRRFEQGDPTIDLPEVMIAMQKSSVSFQAMTQVRNKLIEAYKDVMNMPV